MEEDPGPRSSYYEWVLFALLAAIVACLVLLTYVVVSERHAAAGAGHGVPVASADRDGAGERG